MWGKATLIIGALVALVGGNLISSLRDSNPDQVGPLPADSVSITERTEAAPVESPLAGSRSLKSPAVEKHRVTEVRVMSYGRRTVQDPSLPVGIRQVRVEGVPGAKILTYEVTTVDGEPAGRRLVSEQVSRRSVTEVVAFGTSSEPPRNPVCSMHYGACVPIGLASW